MNKHLWIWIAIIRVVLGFVLGYFIGLNVGLVLSLMPYWLAWTVSFVGFALWIYWALSGYKIWRFKRG